MLTVDLRCVGPGALLRIGGDDGCARGMAAVGDNVPQTLGKFRSRNVALGMCVYTRFSIIIRHKRAMHREPETTTKPLRNEEHDCWLLNKSVLEQFILCIIHLVTLWPAPTNIFLDAFCACAEKRIIIYVILD